jgi:hypothetical protein
LDRYEGPTQERGVREVSTRYHASQHPAGASAGFAVGKHPAARGRALAVRAHRPQGATAGPGSARAGAAALQLTALFAARRAARAGRGSDRAALHLRRDRAPAAPALGPAAAGGGPALAVRVRRRPGRGDASSRAAAPAVHHGRATAADERGAYQPVSRANRTRGSTMAPRVRAWLPARRTHALSLTCVAQAGRHTQRCDGY